MRGGGVGAGARCHTHPEHVPLVNTMELQLRFLSPSDIDQVKCLCRDWFPIDYPDTWYTEITSNPRFFSLAATLSGSIIGLIVAETKDLSQLAKEDRSLLANCFLSNTKVGYILSLGVCQTYRKQGIASLLLDQLISYLNTNYCHQVKALYLHVLTTNTQAIHFYEHRLEINSILSSFDSKIHFIAEDSKFTRSSPATTPSRARGRMVTPTSSISTEATPPGASWTMSSWQDSLSARFPLTGMMFKI